MNITDLIILLLKLQGANSVTQFRPIALSNFLSKINPKILATRLGAIIGKFIFSNQCGFVKERQSSCIASVSECINVLDHQIFVVI